MGELLLVVLCGFGVGWLAGLLGVGGSFLLVPILHVVLGIPIDKAVGSTACQLLGPATAAVLARKLRREQLRLPLILAGGILMGVLVGTSVLSRAGQIDEVLINGRSIPANELLVLGVYLILLVGIGTFALFEVWQHNVVGRFHAGPWHESAFCQSTVFPNWKPESFQFPSCRCLALSLD